MAIMIRVIILAAIVALVASAAPIASAGTSNARVGGKLHPEAISIGAGKDRGWQLQARLGRAVVVLIGANDYGIVAGRR